MARIDHVSKESVEGAYELINKPNWAIFAGKEIIIAYDENDPVRGAEMLNDYLSLLEQGQSTQIYTLKIFAENAIINQKSKDNIASTNFMLNNNSALRKMPDGTVIIDDRRSNEKISGTSLPGYSLLQNEVATLRRELEIEREKRHIAELKNLEDRFTAQIAGLSKEEKPWYDRVIDSFEKIIDNPEKIENMKSFFSKSSKREWIQPAAAPAQVRISPVSGTNAKEPVAHPATEPPPVAVKVAEIEEKEVPEETIDPILVNNILSPEERALPSDKRNELVLAKMEAMNAEELANPTTDDGEEVSELIEIQNQCVESLEGRIGRPVLTTMLLAVQALNDKDLRKLLDHLF